MQAESQSPFDVLLARLDPDRDRAGEVYEVIRLKLLKFFIWKNCADAEFHADDALDRIARKLHEGTEIKNVNAYAYQVARFIALEQYRQPVATEEMDYQPHVPEPPSARMECLERCLGFLSIADRKLILSYYEGEGAQKIEQRKELGRQLKISMTALKIRACRIRTKLETCINGCMHQA